MKLYEVTEFSRSEEILTESWNSFTPAQQKYLQTFEREIFPLMEQLDRSLVEAQLTADQIDQLFGGVEQNARASGTNRTSLGKVGDAAGAAAKLPGKVLKAIDTKLDELIQMAGEAGPVKNIDAKFEELKKQISTDNPKVAEKIKAVSDWAKENPTKASIALGIMTAAAGFAGAGASGGLAVLFFLNSALNLLKGDKLSAAVGKAAKTTGYAALAGMAFKAISGAIIDNIATGSVAEFDAMEKAMKAANLDAEKAAVFNKLGFTPDALEGASRIRLDGNINNFYYNYDTVLSPDQISQFDKLRDAVQSAKLGTDKYYQAAGKFHDFMASAQNNPQNFKLKVSWEALEAAEQQIKNLGDGFLTRDNLRELMAGLNSSDQIIKTIKDIGDAGANIIQGVVGAAKSAQKDAVKATKPDGEEDKKEESVALKGKKLSEGQVYLLFNNLEQTQIILEADSEQAPVTKKPGVISRTMSNIANKITADKLKKAWKKAGSPMDSVKVAEFLRSQGIDDAVLSPAFKQMKIKLPPAPKVQQSTQPKTQPAAGDTTSTQPAQSGSAPTAQTQKVAYATIKSDMLKLTMKDKRRLVQYLEKQLGGATA